MSESLLTRAERLQQMFPEEKPYRIKQVLTALYNPVVSSWNDVTTLPAAMRQVLEQSLPWFSCTPVKTVSSVRGDTHKVVLQGIDGLLFESVLMKNKRDQWTICVSSQIGCNMGCTFCATGAMGLKRSLNADEIADQYRFWQQFLHTSNIESKRISNVVFMGMGEPMVNVEQVKLAITTWLTYTDLGPTKITVSSVGVLPALQKILTDPTWPPVRIAISLHSPDAEQRKQIVPTTAPNFHEKLIQWTHDYARILGNRRHHITFEYTLINGVNDSVTDAKVLGNFVRKTASTKVNVIPLNFVTGKQYTASTRERIAQFKQVLLNMGIDVTERKTMGDDIAAACGQLALSVKGLDGTTIM